MTTTWQSLTAATVGGLRWTLTIVMALLATGPLQAQLHDSLDAYPPRFFLDNSDCDARIIDHDNSVTGGVGGGACETVTMVTSNGTEAHLVYPIEPVRPIDDLRAMIEVFSASKGASIGLRVRYPFLRDPETRRPVSLVIFGASYQTPGEFSRIGIASIQRPLRIKEIALRSQYGKDCDLADPYVDAVVVNAYNGPGTSAIRLDELRIDGMVPVGDGVITGNRHSSSGNSGSPASRGPAQQSSSFRRTAIGNATTGEVATAKVLAGKTRTRPADHPPAFPVGRITKILQHNGEPLAWVRTLGFDAVLIRRPPDAAILSEALRSRVQVYAPPPTSPDPLLAPLLEPVAGWYIGGGQALDRKSLESTAQVVKRLRSLPSRWQRPIVAAPSDAYRRYSSLVDAVIDDLPPPLRGLSGSEELAEHVEHGKWIAQRAQIATGVASMPPEPALVQAQHIADAIGAPGPSHHRWHAMWLQAMRSLHLSPSAIVYRSTRSLASGSEMDQLRALSVSYVNRMIAVVEPWLVQSAATSPLPVQGAAFDCLRQSSGSMDLLILTTRATRGSEVLAGDGETLSIALGPAQRDKTAWRLTHFSAQRLQKTATATGAKLEIVSPDAVEIVVLSSDLEVSSQLARQAARYARQASVDRWQLATAAVAQARMGWNQAIAMRVTDGKDPPNLIAVAEETLIDAEPLYRAGDTGAALRMAARSDAWALRSLWQLSETLMPGWPMPISSPPIQSGSAEIQSLWRPLMEDDGWSDNLLIGGSLDSAGAIHDGRWRFGRRLTDLATSEIQHVTRGSFAGPGALRSRVAARSGAAMMGSLGGGYAGTVVQIRSPSVRVPAGTAVRIDAMIQTIGFGGPHQGVLMHDTIAGPAMGILVRGGNQWTPVRLYRQTVVGGEVAAVFELLGAGEALIDEVTISVWKPGQQQELNFRPIRLGQSQELPGNTLQ